MNRRPANDTEMARRGEAGRGGGLSPFPRGKWEAPKKPARPSLDAPAFTTSSGRLRDQRAIEATSAAKSLSSFSMPSPSTKRTKPVSFTGAPTVLAAFSTTLRILVSWSMT